MAIYPVNASSVDHVSGFGCFLCVCDSATILQRNCLRFAQHILNWHWIKNRTLNIFLKEKRDSKVTNILYLILCIFNFFSFHYFAKSFKSGFNSKTSASENRPCCPKMALFV